MSIGAPKDAVTTKTSTRKSTSSIVPVADRSGQARELEDFVVGYHLGFGTGYGVGHAHGVADEGAAWTSILTSCTDTFRSPRQDELRAVRDEIRHDPCPARCRRCSRCIHSLAWVARGGRPYLGVDAERAP